MLKSKSFLAVDCGANTIKLAEFDLNESGGLRLKQYAMRTVGQEGAQEATRESALVRALQEMLAEKAFSTKNVNICAPGFHVFSKFVRLPPVDSAKVTQIIKYEAQQNVPFPLEEVVWDYQILGTTDTGELEVLLVAVKTDIVEGLYQCTENAGLRLDLVDVSTATLINVFRFNYSDLPGCTMLLDIGAKTSNLLFLEKGKVFARSINIGANLITQELANLFRFRFEDSEQIKIEKGFVSLSGAYEEPDDPQAAAISKIARQVMTRLHIQVNQTIQFYKGQQNGSPPERVFLAGGASLMAYLPQFFEEKLNLPMEYFNPLRNIQIDPANNLEELAKVAHTMGELVGLGLRNLAHCPVELNLMPKSSQTRQEFNQKKPYILASLFSVALVVFAVGLLQQKLVDVKRAKLEELIGKIQPLNGTLSRLNIEQRRLKEVAGEAEYLRNWLEGRYYWADITPVFRQCLMATEGATETALGAPTGIWIEQLKVDNPAEQGDPTLSQVDNPNPDLPFLQFRGMPMVVNTNAITNRAITHLNLKIRAVDRDQVKPEGNTTVAFEFLKQLQAHTNWFDFTGTNATAFKGSLTTESNTFWIEVLVKLQRPINF